MLALGVRGVARSIISCVQPFDTHTSRGVSPRFLFASHATDVQDQRSEAEAEGRLLLPATPPASMSDDEDYEMDDSEEYVPSEDGDDEIFEAPAVQAQESTYTVLAPEDCEKRAMHEGGRSALQPSSQRLGAPWQCSLAVLR